MIHLDCCCPERRRKRKQRRKETSGELSPLLKKDCRRLYRDEVGGLVSLLDQVAGYAACSM